MAGRNVHEGPRQVCVWCEPHHDLGPAEGDADTHGLCEEAKARELAAFEPPEEAPRLDLVAHLRERIAAGELGGEAQLRAVARSPRLLEELGDRDPDGGVW